MKGILIVSILASYVFFQYYSFFMAAPLIAGAALLFRQPTFQKEHSTRLRKKIDRHFIVFMTSAPFILSLVIFIPKFLHDTANRVIFDTFKPLASLSFVYNAVDTNAASLLGQCGLPCVNSYYLSIYILPVFAMVYVVIFANNIWKGYSFFRVHVSKFSNSIILTVVSVFFLAPIATAYLIEPNYANTGAAHFLMDFKRLSKSSLPFGFIIPSVVAFGGFMGALFASFHAVAFGHNILCKE